jgi:hypothetical protein
MKSKLTPYAAVIICVFLSGCIIPGKTVATGNGLSATVGVLGTQTQANAGLGGLGGVGGVVEGVTGLVGSLGNDVLYVAGNAPLISQLGATPAVTSTVAGVVEVIQPNATGGSAANTDALTKAAGTSVLTAFTPGDQGAESLRLAQAAQGSVVSSVTGAVTGGGGTSTGTGGGVAGAAGTVGSTVSTILGVTGGGSGGLLGGLLP